MCGIAGVVGRSDSRTVASMLEAMAHRGPDGHDQFDDGRRVTLGHRRLAIIGVQDGAQPMGNEDGTVIVTFNGCIYNYLELARILRQKGHVFRTHTDTEVIVHAYEEYGDDCVPHFMGMFAFAVWDARRGRLFCARDRFGVKPFYHVATDEGFWFASEIKALLAAGVVSPRTCQPALRQYLLFQAPLTEETLFEGVVRLRPGHTLSVDSDGRPTDPRRYWDISFAQGAETNEEVLREKLRLLLQDAVSIRLRSDVPLGTHLSGGLDSTLITCLASDLLAPEHALATFNGAFDAGPAYDESGYAAHVAQDLNACLHVVRPTAAEFRDYLPRIIHAMDEPAAGPGVFPQYMVSKLAAQHVKVVLGGQGGDEIFAGYARYLVGYLEECLKGAIENTAQTQQYAVTLSSILPNLPILQQYVPMLRNFWADGLFGEQHDRYYRLMDRSTGCRDIFSPDVFSGEAEEKERFHAIFYGSDAQSFLNRMLYFDLKVHLPALLHVEDRTSMAWGLESRVPLLDHRICELMASISPTVKFRGGQPKYLLRQVVGSIVPPRILHREDKMGFPVPLQEWFRHELRDFVRDILLDGTSRTRGLLDIKALEKRLENEPRFGRAIWGALCLELWYRNFGTN